MRTYESETCRITFSEHHGTPDLLVYAKQHPEWVPFHRYYEWYERIRWERDLAVLLSATGAGEVTHAA